MKFIVDTLGSDEGVKMAVEGTVDSYRKHGFDIVFVGPKEEILSYLPDDLKGVEIIDTKEYIHNDEHPVMAIRKKKNASIVLGLHRLNDDDVDGLVSAGSTGALLSGGYFITKRIDGIERGCLGALLPNKLGGTVLVDTGANMDTTPEILRQFAVMGSVYMEHVIGRENPRVALLNVGEEPTKGDKRAQETYQLLADSPLHFIGNIEGRSMLSEDADVIVADGFVGNVALKTIEGVAKLLLGEIKSGVYSSTKHKLGGMLLKDVFANIKENYNYKSRGGAPLLGVKKPVFKAHGNSDAEAFSMAVSEMYEYAGAGVEKKIAEKIAQLHADDAKQ